MSNRSDHPNQATISDNEHKETIQTLQEEIDKLKGNLGEFLIRKKDAINYFPTETIQRYVEEIKGLNAFIESLISQQKNSSKWGPPMVATGDDGIPYTYPNGNSEDY
ncbi:MAG: hypothetical protein OXN27_19490 [Candidatus Poribacteria bacterium]|nr:hypothetical protein [Candidatus Poribacteria bacterium]